MLDAMPKKPVIDDVDRENLDELVSYFDEHGKSASLPETSREHWDNPISAGFVAIDHHPKGMRIRPTPLGISYIRRSRGHRGKKKGSHATTS